MTKVEKAIDYMKKIAADSKHGYSQISRWGNPDTWSDYDCSSLVISAYQAAGIPVKDKGATYTGNMYKAFTACGFKDVTSKINLATGKGLIAGDILLNHQDHTAMMISTTQLAQASIDENGGIMGGKVGDQTGYEINTRSYYNYPWNCVLRYSETAKATATTKHLYRIRKSWTDRKSQIGAYSNLNNAKKACKAGYTVYDEKGRAVYSVPAKTAPKQGDKITLKGAKLYASSSGQVAVNTLSGTYYLYDGKLLSGKYRITSSKDNCGKKPIGNYVTGWISKNDVK